MEFPSWITERVIARQGRLHPWDYFAPTETAFVIIDMQNFFTQPGYMGACPAAAERLPNINKLASTLRDAGGHVIWVKTCSDGADRSWSQFHSRMLTESRSQRRLTELGKDHPGFDLIAGAGVDDRDSVVVKKFYSALSPGSSDLHEVLQAKGIRNVLIGGTATNVCCDSTARNAMMLDYATVMVHDALAAYTQQEHEWALQNWMLFFGDVLGVSDVASRLDASQKSA